MGKQSRDRRLRREGKETSSPGREGKETSSPELESLLQDMSLDATLKVVVTSVAKRKVSQLCSFEKYSDDQLELLIDFVHGLLQLPPQQLEAEIQSFNSKPDS